MYSARIARSANGLEFVPLDAGHFFALDLQERQRTQYGLDTRETLQWEAAEHYAGQPNCWTCLKDGAPLAIFGTNQTFPPVQGTAYALFGKGVGRAMHAITRFARDVVIGQSGLTRIEAIVRCNLPLPPNLDAAEVPAQLAPLLLARALWHPTPEVRWAMAIGFMPVAVLRKFGAASETHMLLERIA